MTPRADRLEDVVADLVSTYHELAVCLEIELRSRVHAIETANNSGMGVGATDQYVTISTSEASAEVLKLRQRIRALECERDYLMFAISHGL